MPTARAAAIPRTLSLVDIIISAKHAKERLSAATEVNDVQSNGVPRRAGDPLLGRSAPARMRGPGWRCCELGAVPPISADRVQHDHRDLALGLALVIGVGRPELQRLFPQPRALLARGGPGPQLHLC